MRAEDGGKWLLLLFLGSSGSRLGSLGLGHALLELINAPGGIDEFLLASVEWVANIANADNDHRLGGPGFDHVAAGATDLRVHILRMYICFHKRPQKIASPGRLASIKKLDLVVRIDLN